MEHNITPKNYWGKVGGKTDCNVDEHPGAWDRNGKALVNDDVVQMYDKATGRNAGIMLVHFPEIYQFVDDYDLEFYGTRNTWPHRLGERT